jgi:D-alanyl-D-alanine carboxypeptidase
MPAPLPPPPPGYAARLPRYAEATALVSVGLDAQGREAFLDPAAASAWLALKSAATDAGLTVLLISGFRSMERQSEIVQRKLARGLSLAEILTVSAYPGFSEHHTGRALDLAAPACPDLVEAFENTPEFRWLSTHAHRFGFALSYPRGNPRGLAYEPWHWCFHADLPE